MKSKRIILFVFLFSLFTFRFSLAQAPKWVWLKDSINAYANSVATDKNGNIYVCGYFNKAIKFDTIELKANIGNSMFIVKFAPDGKTLWAKTADSGSAFTNAKSITIDNEGNIFITGVFSSPGCKFGNYNLNIKDFVHPEGLDIFIIKYNPAGNIIWATSAGGECGYSEVYSITSDNKSDIYITGVFQAMNLTFDTIKLNNYSQVCGGMFTDVFVAKYNTNGDVIWAKSLGGNDMDWAYSVNTDNYDNVFITGYSYSKSLSIDNINIPLSNSRDMLLAKFNSEGKLLWINNKYGIETYSVATDNKDNCIVSGAYYLDTLIMGKDTLLYENSNLFLTKYSSKGDIIWARTAAKCQKIHTMSVITDSINNVYVGGWFNKQPFAFDTINIPLDKGLFVTKYDSSGNFNWVKCIETDGKLRALHCDKFGNIYVAGDFLDTIAYDSVIIYQKGTFMLLAKLAPSLITTIKSAPEPKADLFLYPNPCTDELYINVSHFPNVKHLITVYDIHGKAIFQTQTAQTPQTQTAQTAQPSITINTRSFPPGLYLTRIQSPNSTNTRKFIKF